MALLHLLLSLQKDLSFELAVAHVNYQLRGEESDAAKELIVRFCEEKKIPCFVLTTSTLKKETKNLQVAARNIRYEYFEKLCREHAYNIVAVGHHRQDQVETVFERLLRGASFRGLSGMKTKRELSSSLFLIRPLLSFSKEWIEDYASKQGIATIEDTSNLSSKYWRNEIRKDLIPVLKRLRPKSLDKIVRFAKEMETLSDFLASEARKWLYLYAKKEDDLFWLPRPRWMELPEPLRREIFRQVFLSFPACGSDLKQDHLLRCEQISLSQKRNGVYSLPHQFLFERVGDDLMVRAKAPFSESLRLEGAYVSLKI